MSFSASSPDLASRSYTALFVLAGTLANKANRTADETDDDINYPINRPGQNSVECYTLAVLAFSLGTGFFTVVIGGVLGSHLWSFALALPLGFLLAFLALHILFFGFAFIYRRLRAIHLVPRSAPEKLPAGFYLCFFTLFALAIASSGNLALVAVAAPWLTWLIINFFAWMILLVAGFISQLRGKP